MGMRKAVAVMGGSLMAVGLTAGASAATLGLIDRASSETRVGQLDAATIARMAPAVTTNVHTPVLVTGSSSVAPSTATTTAVETPTLGTPAPTVTEPARPTTTPTTAAASDDHDDGSSSGRGRDHPEDD